MCIIGHPTIQPPIYPPSQPCSNKASKVICKQPIANTSRTIPSHHPVSKQYHPGCMGANTASSHMRVIPLPPALSCLCCSYALVLSTLVLSLSPLPCPSSVLILVLYA